MNKHAIVKIDVLSSSLEHPIKIKEPILFGFEVQVDQNYNVEKNLTFIHCKVKIIDSVTKTSNIQTLFGKISTLITFQVEDLGKYVDDNGEVQLNQDFLMILNATALSTTRGIMYSYFKGTFLHNAILPIFDVTQFKYTSIAPNKRRQK